MMINPKNAGAVVRERVQMIRGLSRSPRKIGNPELMGAATPRRLQLLYYTIAFAVSGKLHVYRRVFIKSLHRGRSHHPVKAGGPVANHIDASFTVFPHVRSILREADMRRDLGCEQQPARSFARGSGQSRCLPSAF